MPKTLDGGKRLELTRKLFLFRMELAYEAWADKEFLARLDLGGRMTPEEELWRDYEQEIERQWPAYRDYGMRNYSDGELTKYVDAYWGVAQERMRHEVELERRGPSPAAAYRDVCEDYRLKDQQVMPANENRMRTATDATQRPHGRASKHSVQASHPWPSQIAKANRHKQAELDHGESSGVEKANGKDTGHSM
jgi:hypothetical protein